MKKLLLNVLWKIKLLNRVAALDNKTNKIFYVYWYRTNPEVIKLPKIKESTITLEDKNGH